MSTRNFVQSAVRCSTPTPAISKRLLIAALVPALALGGCIVMPGPDGTPWLVMGGPMVPHDAPVAATGAAPSAPRGSAFPKVLNVRLYPANDVANATGVLSGTVTNMMTGKGRFQFHYQGELLAGEATRVSGEERKGIAAAYGPRGTYASCEYQLNTPFQGAGTCQFSDGAKYQLHIGS